MAVRTNGAPGLRLLDVHVNGRLVVFKQDQPAHGYPELASPSAAAGLSREISS